MTKIKIEVEFEIDDEMWGANSQDIDEKKWFWDTVIPTSFVILHNNEVSDSISQASKFTIKELTTTSCQPYVADNDKCSSCSKNDAKSLHACPFAEDVHNDRQSLCNCCDNCVRECCAEI